MIRNYFVSLGQGLISLFDVWLGTGSDQGNASRVPHQRSMFEANGLQWLFYTQYDTGGEPYTMGFISSANGQTWSSFTALTKPCHFADAGWSILYDGTYVHVLKTIEKGIPSVPLDLGVHRGLEYRRGQTNANGTITWSAVWQTVLATDKFVGDISVCITTDNKIVVGYNDGPFEGDATVIKNDNEDGTWSNQSGFPFQVTTFEDIGHAIVSPLISGGFYVAYYHWGPNDHRARGYFSTDGTASFTDDGEITDDNMELSMFVAPIEIADDGDGIVHLVYLSGSDDIKYKSRATNGTWSSEFVISATGSDKHTPEYSAPRLSFDELGNKYVVWSDAFRNKLMGKKFVSSWGGYITISSYDIIYEATPRTTLITIENFTATQFQWTDLLKSYQLIHGTVNLSNA